MAMEYWNAHYLPASVRPPFNPAQHCRIGSIFVKEGFRAIDRLRLSQERLGREFEKVLFDNLPDLYAR